MLMCMVRICLEGSEQRANLYIQFDSSGSNGGCSAIINIVPNTTAFSNSCTNDTLNWLRGPLDLDAVDASGSWPPWPGQVSQSFYTSAAYQDKVSITNTSSVL